MARSDLWSTASRFFDFASMAGFSDLARRCGRWWLREFLALFPERVAEWLIGRGRRVLALSTEHDAMELHLRTEGGRVLASTCIDAGDYSPTTIDRFLQSHDIDRANVSIGLCLPAERFFRRTLVLPVEVIPSLEKVIVADLIAKTPFRLQDIHHGHVATRDQGSGKIVVSQWVIRREFVADALARFGSDVDDFSFIEGVADAGASSPTMMLRPDHGHGTSWLPKAVSALAVCAALLALTASGLEYWHQQSMLDHLEAKVAAARSKAQQVRAAIGRLEQKQAVTLRLRSRKTEQPALIDVWEEATRLLPSHSWLTEMRLSQTMEGQDQQVSMTGLSAAASTLVGLIDQSPLFADATLTAPVTLDPVEGRERFALQARLAAHREIKKASR
jgi:general secretion pathway protein L